MDFGEALRALKTGKRVTREGWNGQGLWIAYMPGTTIPDAMVNARTKKFVPPGDLKVGGYLAMWTGHHGWQPGWVASQSDMLGDDWVILPE